MAKTSFFYGALLSGTMISGMFGSMAFAADLETSGSLPAVSAVNGKVEFMGGAADSDLAGSDEAFYGGAALSIPLGERFGFQGDIAVLDVFGETAVGATGHLFTRDPNSYLLGAIGGYVDVGSNSMLWGGAEGELYMDNVTFRGIAGMSDVDITGGTGGTDFLGIAELALYATDNLKLSVGASSVAEFESARVGMEWLMQDQLGMPVALKAEASVGEDGFVGGLAGISFYFGGNQSDKSLIRRHREDDPEISAFAGSALNIFGSGLVNGGPGAGGEDPEYDPCSDPEYMYTEMCTT